MLGILQHPNVNPVIFTLWSNAEGEPVLALRWYGLMYVFAFVFGYLVFRWLQKTGYLRMKAEDVTNIIVVGVLGTFLGGRLGYLLFYQFDKLFLGKGDLPISERFAMIYKVYEGGMSFHGGVFGVGLAVLIYAWRKRQNFWNILDGAVHIVPFGVAMVRVGNFINGELYGRVFTDEAGNTIYDADKLPWYAMKFPTDHNDPIAAERLQSLMRQDYFATHPDATRVPDAAMQPLPVKPEIWDQVSQYFPGRWPSQVVQFAFEGMLVLLIVWLLRRYFKRPGQLTGAFLMLYCICRIPAEMIRQPDMQIDPAKAAQLGGTAAFLQSIGMTMGQFLSVVVFLIGLIWILAIYFKPFTGREYTIEERRSGFLRQTIKDLPEILGLRKKPKAPDKPEAESASTDEPTPDAS
ncbi:MAG: prolipoprotein diacylglyceryl transferase [Planctomycetes bacterium]|nr:prolipoprotein diacylglyceryl transferase [Planctomycetota bacterium]